MLKSLTVALLTVLLFSPAYAEEAQKPDDRVAFDLAAEDWVSTKTARVTAHVEAAVSAATAGNTRAEMIKSVNTLAAGDWRLTSFNRGQDQTGLERWSANFESRLPENTLGGLAESARKQSKPGMQLSIIDIDFSPTLEEIETVRGNLRTQIYKKVADQLTALNGALPGRTYRIASIDFISDQTAMPMVAFARAQSMASNAGIAQDSAPDVQRSEKLRAMAHVVLATAPSSDAKH